jgi:hypothetical protein
MLCARTIANDCRSRNNSSCFGDNDSFATTACDRARIDHIGCISTTDSQSYGLSAGTIIDGGGFGDDDGLFIDDDCLSCRTSSRGRINHVGGIDSANSQCGGGALENGNSLAIDHGDCLA